MLRAALAALAGVVVGLGPAITPAGAAAPQILHAQEGSSDQGSDQAEQTNPSPEGEGSALTWSVQPAGEEGADGRPHWEFELEPGESVEDVAQLNNFSDEVVTFRVYSHDAINSPEGGFTLQPANEEPKQVGAWIGLDEEITVEPGDSVTIPFTLTVPQDAVPGDHAGGIVASVTSQTTDAQGQQVLVENRVGSRIYLRVAGEVTPALQVSNLSVSYDRSWVPFTAGSTTVSYELRNTGNIRLAGEQSISGHGLFGWGEHSVSIEPAGEILPGESVTVSHEVEGVLPLFRITEEVLVTPEAPQTGTATALPVVQATDSAQAWALPWVELLILAVILLWVVLGWWRRRRSKKKSAAQIEEAVAKAKEEVRREMQESSAASTSEAGPGETRSAETRSGTDRPADSS